MDRRNFLASGIAATLLPASAIAGYKNTSSDKPLINNIPALKANTFDNGMPAPYLWFTSDRLSFEMDKMGVTSVTFFNPLSKSGNPFIFRRRLFDGFRLYIEHNKITYSPKMKDFCFYSFGFQSTWLFKQYEIKYGVYAIQESILFSLELPENAPKDILCKLEFYESFQLTPCDTDDFMFSDWGAQRKWGSYQFLENENALTQSYTESQSNGKNPLDDNIETGWESFLNITLTADFEIEHTARKQNIKHILKSKNFLSPGKPYNYIITFMADKMAVPKTKEILKNVNEVVKNQIETYLKITSNIPVLVSENNELNKFIALAPIISESLKIKSYPGANRSNNAMYWVWGWDSLTSLASYSYWGDVSYLKKILRFFHTTAHPEKGIAHSYLNDMSIALYSYTTSQAIYISALYNYYIQTGDIDVVSEHYSFCTQIFDRILQLEIQNTGLCSGYTLFPDFPVFMKENGNDISLFNNSLFYGGARSMECLAILMGDNQMRDKARQVFTRTESNFVKLFFDTDKNFFVSSIDAKTLEKRDSYNLSSVKWDMGFFADLIDTISPAAMKFIDENLISNVGLREIPVWNDAFDGDANQLHCWFSADTQFFIRTAVANNRGDLISKFIGWIEFWTKNLTCPEAINYYAENDEPEIERWNSFSGDWSLFGLKEWYQCIIHGVAGIDTGPGGITFYPYNGSEISISGLHYKNNRFDISIKGSGNYIDYIDFDGTKYTGTHILPMDKLKNAVNQRFNITVHRTGKLPAPVFIKSGFGVGISDYRNAKNEIEANVNGIGTCNLKIYAQKEPEVKVNGILQKVAYYPKLNLAVVKLIFDDSKGKKLKITV